MLMLKINLPALLVNIIFSNLLNYVFCQITTRRINFIIDRSDNSAMRDVDGKGNNDVQEKDRSWLISSLHQVYSRRLY